MASFGGFRPAAFQFLRDLGRNNEKAWFEANRDLYEREVRDPMRLLVESRADRTSWCRGVVGRDRTPFPRVESGLPPFDGLTKCHDPEIGFPAWGCATLRWTT